MKKEKRVILTFYHWRNWVSLKKHFIGNQELKDSPVKFIGFGCGYYSPSFFMPENIAKYGLTELSDAQKEHCWIGY